MAPTTLQKLAHLLSLSSHQADRLANHTLRLLSTTKGLDAFLRTAYYTLLLLHAQLTRTLSKKYEKLAVSIASKASETMLPGETLVATIEPPHLRLTEWCARTRAAGDLVEDVRLFLRVGGLLRLYARAQETWRKGKRDPAIRLLTWAGLSATMGYQVFENGAYLIRRGVLSGHQWQGRERKWWVWSSRCWLAIVAIDLAKLARVRQLRYNEDWGAEMKIEDDAQMKIQSKELEERWWRAVYADLGWLPTALHFSYYDEERSPVSEAWIGAAALIPASYALQDAWQEASK